jgi:hypothetical protein
MKIRLAVAITALGLCAGCNGPDPRDTQASNPPAVVMQGLAWNTPWLGATWDSLYSTQQSPFRLNQTGGGGAR